MHFWNWSSDWVDNWQNRHRDIQHLSANWISVPRTWFHSDGFGEECNPAPSRMLRRRIKNDSKLKSKDMRWENGWAEWFRVWTANIFWKRNDILFISCRPLSRTTINQPSKLPFGCRQRENIRFYVFPLHPTLLHFYADSNSGDFVKEIQVKLRSKHRKQIRLHYQASIDDA